MERWRKRSAVLIVIAFLLVAVIFIAVPSWQVGRCLAKGGQWADPGDYCVLEPD